MIYFTSDLHFGHKNIITFDKRPFENIDIMKKEITDRWNSKVDPKDSVYILGDISWYNPEETYQIYKNLNGDKHLILGNHDRRLGKAAECFSEIVPYKEIEVDGEHVILCHYPIHFYNAHYYGAIMLYGHVHSSYEEELVQNYRKELNVKGGINCEMYNVGCMHWDYYPVSLKEILEVKNEKRLKS